MFWTTLLIIHGLLAVTLLGAITHQAVALWVPVRVKTESFVARFRAVPSTSYVGAIVVLYVLTFILGAWIYTHYRFTARLALERTLLAMSARALSGPAGLAGFLRATQLGRPFSGKSLILDVGDTDDVPDAVDPDEPLDVDVCVAV